MLSISRDGGYAESFQYLKLAGIIGILCFCAISERSAAAGGWAIIFAILLLDDRLAIHERIGAQIADWLSFEPMFNLRAIDFGEIIVFATWGIIAIAILAFTYRNNRSVIDKQIFKVLSLSLLGLAVFGGFFDMLHIAVETLFGKALIRDELLDILEDGGEMVVVSLGLYFVYKISLEIVAKHQHIREESKARTITR